MSATMALYYGSVGDAQGASEGYSIAPRSPSGSATCQASACAAGARPMGQ